MESFFRVPLGSSSIEVSSFNSELENKLSLIDGDAGTYWHVKYPTESHEHWVLIDLGTPHSLAALRVKPRKGVAEQLWDGANAVFQGSNDRLTWASLGTLTVDKGKLNNEDPRWLTFPVRSGNGFRYYRLLIKDSGFLSLAEVELYSGERPAPTPPPAPSPTPPSPPTPASAPEPTPGLLTPAESNDGSFESWAARDGVLPKWKAAPLSARIRKALPGKPSGALVSGSKPLHRGHPKG
jgi:hypothetical protein